MDETFYTVDEARQLLKISRVTLYRWINTGRIPATKLGGTYRIRKQDIDAFLNGRLAFTGIVDNTDTAPTRNPLSITASDIEKWASKNRKAQEVLPELIRRLLQAVQQEIGLIDIHIPSGDSIGQPGWDGRTESKRDYMYIPAGISAWEMGTGPAKDKANDDYKKRTDNPLNVQPSKTAFIFVTTEVWAGKEDWVNAKQKDAIWKDVRVIDANNLEAWLEMLPPVKAWFLGVLGRSAEGVNDLETWWEDWSHETRPSMSIGLTISGRKDATEHLQQNLVDATAELSTLIAESRLEALAFIVATVLSLPDEQRGITLSSTLIIENQANWDRVIAFSKPLILIAHFNEPDRLGRAVDLGHKVIVPLDKASPAAQTGIVLDRPKKETILDELKKMGVGDKERGLLASLGQHSLLSLWRRFSLAGSIKTPAWLEDSDALIPALLMGKWDERFDGDKTALVSFTDGSYEAFIRKLERLQGESDAPIGRVGSKWYVVSKEDMWHLLRTRVTRHDVHRFAELVNELLAEVDPSFSLPHKDRWMASIYDKNMRHSRELRESVADTLALLCADYGEVIVGGQKGSAIVASITYKLLEKANEDITGQLWATLGDVLPLLAEASPDEFLDALDEGLQSKRLNMSFIFQDSKEDPSFTSSSPHTGFLWALEGLAWSPRFLLRVSSTLCKLHKLDPGGRLVNRPSVSLRDIFLSWHPQTTADPDQRLTALKYIVVKYPVLGWELLLAILPATDGLTTGTYRPKRQEWAPDTMSVTYADLFTIVDSVANLILQNVGMDVQRWKHLFEHYHEMPLKAQEQIIEWLLTLPFDQLKNAEQKQLWNAVRDFVYKNRRFSAAKWAVSKQHIDRMDATLARLEPTDMMDKYEWLFNYRANLSFEGEGWEVHEAKIWEARLDAATKLHASGGLPMLIEITDRVESPQYLGVAIGRAQLLNDIEYQEITAHIKGSIALGQMVRACITTTFHQRGWDWVNQLMTTSPLLRNDPELLATFLALLPHAQATWEVVEVQDQSVQSAYWTLCLPFGLENNDDYLYVAQKLLDAGRPHDAVQALAMLLEQATKIPTGELAMYALEDSVKSKPANLDLMMFSYDIAKLLDFLDGQPETDRSRLARIEWQVLPLLKANRGPKVLHEELSINPAFFAEVIAWVYRSQDDQSRDQPTSEEKTRAHLAYTLLDQWSSIPGSHAGVINQVELDQWVDTARELLEASGRKKVGDQVIGRMLSHSPYDDGGIWPALPIRNVIERLESREIEEGFRIAVFNHRGVTTRALGEGGKQERELAKKYDDLAEKIDDLKWPRTKLSLMSIAKNWRQTAEYNDNRAAEYDLE